MSAMEDVDEGTYVPTEDESGSSNLGRVWNLAGLRKEVSRQTVRFHKKVGKANQRLDMAQREVDRLTTLSDRVPSVEELEACPNVEELAAQADDVKNRLKQLNRLEVMLQDMKGKSIVLPEHIALLAIELGVKDQPPPATERGTKKEKGPRKMDSFRLPYRRYYTENKTEIRVSVRVVFESLDQSLILKTDETTRLPLTLPSSISGAGW
jgi:hypothetical protein